MKLDEVNNLPAYAVYKNMFPGVKVYQDTNQPINLKKRLKRQLQAKAKKELEALAAQSEGNGSVSVSEAQNDSIVTQLPSPPPAPAENGKKKNKQRTRKRKSTIQPEAEINNSVSETVSSSNLATATTLSDAPPTKLRKNMLPNPLSQNFISLNGSVEKTAKNQKKKLKKKSGKLAPTSNGNAEIEPVKNKKAKNTLIPNGEGNSQVGDPSKNSKKDMKNKKKAKKVEAQSESTVSIVGGKEAKLNRILSQVVATSTSSREDPCPEPKGTTSRIASLFGSKPVQDSVEHGKNLFEWLVSPTSPTKFMSDHWEKKPLHIKRSSTNPDYYKWLLSSSKIDDIMRTNLIRFGKNVDITSYTNGERETHNPVGRAMPAAVWDYYSNGCSVRFLNPQTYVKPLWRLNALLQEYFGTFVGANVYLTPPDSQGFAPHYDDIEAFILQIEGKKHWKVYKPRVAGEELPRFSSGNFSEEKDNIGEPVLDVVLEEGDLLYFPRGWIHQASASDEHSLHVTISCYQTNSWGDLMKEYLASAVDQAMVNSVDFRRGLPVDYLSYMGIVHQDSKDKAIVKKRESFLKKTKNLVEQLVKFTTPDLAADQLGKKFMWDSLPPYLTLKEKSTSSFSDGEFMDEGHVFNRCELDPDVEVKLVRKHCVRLVREENSLRLYFTLENSMEWHGEEAQFVEIPAEAEDGIKFLISQYPEFVKIDELPLADVTQKVQLIADLWERGIVVTKEPLVPMLDEDDFLTGPDGEEEEVSEGSDWSVDLDDEDGEDMDEDADFSGEFDEDDDDEGSSEGGYDIEGDHDDEGSVDGFELDMGDSDSDDDSEDYEDDNDEEVDSEGTDDDSLGKSFIEEITSGDDELSKGQGGGRNKKVRPGPGLSGNAFTAEAEDDESDDDTPPQLVSAPLGEKKQNKKKNNGKGKGKEVVATPKAKTKKRA